MVIKCGRLVAVVNFRILERQLKSVANSKRLQILQQLKMHGAMSVTEVSRTVRLSRKATSKHLHILEEAGLLKRHKRGLYVIYRLSLRQAAPLKQVVGLL